MLVTQLPATARGKFAAHLLALGAEDRRLRFGCAMADAAVEKYVQNLDFRRDALFGVYGINLDLAGACHVAQAGDLAEFGVSVSTGERRRGIGSALVARAALHARNAGIGALFMHCLSENRSMMRIAHQLGMRVITECGESDGQLVLPARDFQSVFDEMAQQGLALYDYSSKAGIAAARLLFREAMIGPARIT